MAAHSPPARRPLMLPLRPIAVAFLLTLCGIELSLLRRVHSNRVASLDVAVPPTIPVNAPPSARIIRPRSIPPPPPLRDTSKHEKKPPPPRYAASAFENCTILRHGDSIYQYGPWDGAPIVLERFRLLLFTIPKNSCTVLKQLARRIMSYKDYLDDVHPLPHAPKRNGLQYLYDYPPSIADTMLTDPSWTRAIIIRDPMERLLSAYLDKGRQNAYMQFHCCLRENDDDEAAAESTDTTTTQGQHYLLLQQLLNCTHRLPHLGPTASEKQDKQSLPFLSFHDFLALIPNSMCRNDPHFQPQAQRMEHKYWKYINFIGHMETISTDVEQLLKQVGAWDDYGASGWPNTNQAIFASSTTVHHKTDASSKLQDYYAPGSETLAMATKLCEQDYAIIPGLQNKIR